MRSQAHSLTVPVASQGFFIFCGHNQDIKGTLGSWGVRMRLGVRGRGRQREGEAGGGDHSLTTAIDLALPQTVGSAK